MNSLIHSHTEAMVKLEMEDCKKEMESIRLIQEAGLSNPGLLEKMAITIGKTLVRLGHNMKDKYLEPHQAHQVTSRKLAS